MIQDEYLTHMPLCNTNVATVLSCHGIVNTVITGSSVGYCNGYYLLY